MARAKKKVVVAPSKNDLVPIMKRYAGNQSKIKVLNGKKEQAVQKLTDRIEGINETFDKQAQPILEALDADFEKLQAYAQANQESEFSKKKSKDLINGVIGFRTDNPSVGTIKGVTQKVALQTLIDMGNSVFVRRSVALDKDAILKNRDNAEVIKAATEAGIIIVQEEQFFVEVKEEDLSNA